MVAFSIQPSIVQASNVLRRNFDNQNGRSLNQAQLFFEKVYLQSKNNDNEFEEDDLYARTQYVCSTTFVNDFLTSLIVFLELTNKTRLSTQRIWLFR
jgi:hypothetical protein